MAAGEINNLNKITVTTDEARVIFYDCGKLEDEIEILAATEYDACLISPGKITFFSKAINSPKNDKDPKASKFRTGKYADSNTWELQAQDIVWAKHTANQPFWPAYVTTVFKDEISLFYIFRSNFADSTMAHKKDKSDLIPYSSSTLGEITTNGLDYYREEGHWDIYDDFFKAVSMAKTYHLLKLQKHFTSERTSYEFFNLTKPTMRKLDYLSPPVTPQKNTLTLCEKESSSQMKKCTPQKNTLQLCEKEISSEMKIRTSQKNTLKLCEKVSSLEMKKRTPQKNTLQLCEKEISSEMEIRTPQKNTLKYCEKEISSEIKIRKRKISLSAIHDTSYHPEGKRIGRVLDNFDRCSQRVLGYILNGRCDHHIGNVLRDKIQSSRMEHFKKDYRNYKQRKAWELVNVHPYFRYENQQDDVMHYLRNILYQDRKRRITRLPITRFMQLLLDVLYPEAIIWAISKIKRLIYHEAEHDYKGSQLCTTTTTATDDDPIFKRKLNAAEKKIVVRRNKAILDEMKLANKSF